VKFFGHAVFHRSLWNPRNLLHLNQCLSVPLVKEERVKIGHETLDHLQFFPWGVGIDAQTKSSEWVKNGAEHLKFANGVG
jgi:hypothetical protein